MEIRVGNVMTAEVIAFNPDDKISHVIEIFRKEEISGAPVVEKGQIVGIISQADIIKLDTPVELPEVEIDPLNPLAIFDLFSFWKTVKKIPEELKRRHELLLSGCVRDVMSKKPVTISPDASISEAAKIMRKNDFNRLPVVDREGKLMGIIARQDVIGVLASRTEKRTE